jgi:hypothetical protein
MRLCVADAMRLGALAEITITVQHRGPSQVRLVLKASEQMDSTDDAAGHNAR